jgi:hypothetical protein
MTAWQRSRITERSEKGIGPISFKRLLIAGASGGIVAMLGGRLLGFFPGCLSAGLALAAVLAATHPVEGRPLFVFGFRTLRGLATVAAVRRESTTPSLLGQVLKVSDEEGTLRAGEVYGAPDAPTAPSDLLDVDWEYLGGFADAGGEGLSAADNPFQTHDTPEGVG